MCASKYEVWFCDLRSSAMVNTATPVLNFPFLELMKPQTCLDTLLPTSMYRNICGLKCEQKEKPDLCI